MKKVLLTILVLILAVGYASAQAKRTVSLRVGEQKTAAGRLHINFIEVTDDSRCPVDATCVWAGNAKVKLALSKGTSKTAVVELNSNLKPTAIEYLGSEITFVSLTRKPTQPGRMTMVRPLLVVSVKRLKH